MITLLVASLSIALVWGPLLGWDFSPPTSLSLIRGFAVFGLIGGLPIALGMATVLPWSAYQLAHLRPG